MEVFNGISFGTKLQFLDDVESALVVPALVESALAESALVVSALVESDTSVQAFRVPMFYFPHSASV